MQKLQVSTRGVTWAIFQCEYGASSSKPTRFLSNLPACRALRGAVWPIFDKHRNYRGPLPSLVHVDFMYGSLQARINLANEHCRLPAGLCRYLASFITSVLRKGDTCDEPQSGACVTVPLENTPPLAPTKVNVEKELECVSNQGADPNKVQSNLKRFVVGDSKHGEKSHVDLENWGKPINVEWASEEITQS